MLNPIVSKHEKKIDNENKIQNLINYEMINKIQKKLSNLVLSVSNQNNACDDDFLSLGTKVQSELLLQSDKQKNIQDLVRRTLYQIQVLEILLSQNKLVDTRASQDIEQKIMKLSQKTHNKSPSKDITFKQDYANKQDENAKTLKQIIFSLCDDTLLQQCTKSFLKTEVQNFFQSRFQTSYLKQSVVTETQHHLESFIFQIQELRNKIQDLSQKNEQMKQQNLKLIQKLYSSKNLSNITNQSKNWLQREQYINYDQSFNIQSYKKLQEECIQHQRSIRNLQAKMKQKQLYFNRTNVQFSEQIAKYNKVFQKLDNQNKKLDNHIKKIEKQNKKLQYYVNYDAISVIQNLQSEVIQLRQLINILQKNGQSSKGFDFSTMGSIPKGSKFSSNRKIETHEYLPQHIFSNDRNNQQIQDKIYWKNRVSAIRKSRQNELYNRPNSHRSTSPIRQLRKSNLMNEKNDFRRNLYS